MKLSRLKPHLGLLVILLMYFAITLYTSWQVPLSVGPDEAAHFMLARFLRQEARLPVSAKDFEAAGYKSDQPPLNSIIIAAAYFWGDITSPPFVKLTHSVPRRHLAQDGLVDPTGRTFYIVNTEDPLAGEFLFWRFGRLMSTIFSGLTLVVIYLTALKIFEQRPHKNMWALAAVMSIAFIPTYIFISGVFSYENLLGLWLALYLLVLVYIIRGHQSSWLFGLAGLLAGLAIITKLAAAPVPLSLALAVAAIGYRSAWPLRTYLKQLALSLSGMLVGCGWWFAWIELNFNRVTEMGWYAGLLYPLVNDEASEQILYTLTNKAATTAVKISPTLGEASAKDMFYTFWSFYGLDQYLAWTILLVLTMFLVLGLAQVWWRHKEIRLWLALLSLYTAFFFMLPFVRLLTTGFASKAGQGQHVLFPAAGAWAILIMLGISGWFPMWGDVQWRGGLLLGLGLLAWSINLVVYTYPQAVPVPVRTVPPVAPTSAQPVDIDFGPLALKGYEVTNNPSKADPAALQIKLYWLAKELMAEDYLTLVSLVNPQGQAQSMWMGYGANGRYPSRAWEPGDIIRDELYLPLVGLQPTTYTLTLQVKGRQGPLTSKNGPANVTLTQVDLAQHQADLPIATPNKPPFEVWQNGQAANSAPVFEHNATVQITTDPVEARLIGPDQVQHAPVAVAGRTQIFIIDPLWPRGDYRFQLKTNPPTASLALKVAGIQRETKIPQMQTVANTNFANYIMLLGYDISQNHLMAGESLPLTLYWQAIQTVPTDFIMFTRLYDQNGQAWGGYDRWPREYYSPIMWAAGEVVEDGFTLPVRPDVPTGVYYVDIGFYLVVGQAPVSLPLVQDGKLSNVTKVSLGPFIISNQTN